MDTVQNVRLSNSTQAFSFESLWRFITQPCAKFQVKKSWCQSKL